MQPHLYTQASDKRKGVREMKGKYSRRVAALILIGGLTIGLLWYFAQILLVKRLDGITTIQNFYVQPENSVDVLMVGSSHMGMNIDPGEMWHANGISSYNLWGSVQPTWNSYFFLKEALKYQTPKLVIMDAYGAINLNQDYSDDARQVANVLGMRMSLNKIQAIAASSPEERWNNMFLMYPIIHDRIDEVYIDDFLHFPWNKALVNEKGYSPAYGHYGVPFEFADEQGSSEVTELYPKSKEYLIRIIELLKEKGIPMVLVQSPVPNAMGQEKQNNALEIIAEQYDVPFYNLNLLRMEMGIEQSDFLDIEHLNAIGARKMARYLADILQEEYDLEDHRNDPRYQSWEVYYQNNAKNYLKAITDVGDYFSELADREYTVIVVKNSTWEITDEFLQLLDAFATITSDSKEIEISSGGCWILDNPKKGEIINQFFGDMQSTFEYDGHTFGVDFNAGLQVLFDKKVVSFMDGAGMCFLVYNKDTRECIDAVQFLESEGFQLKHLFIE